VAATRMISIIASRTPAKTTFLVALAAELVRRKVPRDDDQAWIARRGHGSERQGYLAAIGTRGESSGC